MSLFEQPFFNRRNWILENLEILDLTLEEAMVVLYIDYFNEFNKTIDIVSISKKLKMDGNHVDHIFSNLMGKGYLKFEVINRRMVYSLNGLFLQKDNNKPCNQNEFRSLFELYEKEFKRPLSQRESEQLSEWISLYDLKLIEYALREAIIYDSLSFAYIDKILKIWKEKNYTATMYEDKQ